jgi:diaminohydroxyphosphoribosylaminopyrimidine deaminase / 5-amino-6-(5-phosphoribosylamino)uracil reductase
MKRCLELANSGLGHVAPNPMVGAIVIQNDKVIGEGYHIQYGQAHAEVNAIHAVKDPLMLGNSTLYVNLEPCTHVGKTPPCSDLIISKGIRKVVIGMTDPNPVVGGKGVEKLRKNGVEVITNILTKECRELNRRFITFYEKQRPYIILKWAQTNDKYIDLDRKPGEPVGINWISNPLSRTTVHRWRSEEQAIMVGTNTVLTDNPQLNVRHWKGNSPIRIVLDRSLRISSSSNVFDNSSPTLIFNEKKNEKVGNNEFIQIDFGSGMFNQLFHELFNRQIQSVIVEGGKKLLESLIKQNIWDEARVLIGDKNFGKGYAAPAIPQKAETITNILNDRLLFYRNHSTA